MSDVFSLLRSALEENRTEDPVLLFGKYTITSFLGEGEQGIVVKASNTLQKEYAIKFHINDLDPHSNSCLSFQREVTTLLKLNHKSIVGVYTGGTASFDREWTVNDFFVGENSSEDYQYYIMDYIDKSLLDMFPTLHELPRNPEPSTKLPNVELRRTAGLFEELIIQLIDAISYYQGQNITHKDIKPENIRYNPNDSTFIIVDFGFVRHLGSRQEEKFLHKKRCMDWSALAEGRYDLADIGSLSLILQNILAHVAPVYDDWRYNALDSCIEKALASELSTRYETVLAYGSSLQRYFVMHPSWNLTIAQGECLTHSQFGRFSSGVRIPKSKSILWTKEVCAIVDSAEFQRLRGTRQLGPTMFVFPGANHTRFEHSLGTYDLSLKYLECLLRKSHGSQLDENLEYSIKLIVLSALLHDIGHYPYSHWIEEIDEFPYGIQLKKHESRARDIINAGDITEIIQDVWEICPNDVANVIAGEHIADKSLALANSFIDSPIDVDKVDYLIRDSIHCGVDYGKGIDADRLIDSLHINTDTIMPSLCITDKGIPSLLSLVTCRNVLYQSVYWHKTVRACEAMFKRYIYELIDKKMIQQDELEQLFRLSDDSFTKAIYEKNVDNSEIGELMTPFVFLGRKLYKPVYIFYESLCANESKEVQTFFLKLLNNSTYKNLVRMSLQLAKELTTYINDVKDIDVLLETTPIKSQHTDFNLESMSVWHSRKNMYHPLPRTVLDVDRHLSQSRQAYLLCHPRHYERLQELCESKEFEKILSRFR